MKNYQGEGINIIGKIMSALTDSVTKNFSADKKKEFFKRLSELSGLMSEESAVDLVLIELFKEGYAKGGIADLLKI